MLTKSFPVLQICPTLAALREAIDFYFYKTVDGPSPQYIIMGGGFDQEAFQEAQGLLPRDNTVNGAHKVIWVRPAFYRPGAEGVRPAGGPPSPSSIAARVRTALLSDKEEVDCVRYF